MDGMLTSLLVSHWTTAVFMVLLAVGTAIAFVGVVVSLLTALGNRSWLWAIAILLCAPLAIAYCLMHRAIAAWPTKLLSWGFGLMLIAAGPVAWHIWQMMQAALKHT